MSFTKSELQSLRFSISSDISGLIEEMNQTKFLRSSLYENASIDDPTTIYTYLAAKTVSNRLSSLKKQLKKKETLLRKVKAEIKKEDDYTTLINLDVDLNFGLLDKFFAFVRGTK